MTDIAHDLPTLDVLTERYIRHVLEHCEWNVEKAALHLGINRRTVYRKVDQYGIELPWVPRTHGDRRK